MNQILLESVAVATVVCSRGWAREKEEKISTVFVIGMIECFV
jgi:hypothetical protein